MSLSELVFRGKIWQIPTNSLMVKCKGFDADPTLLAKPYEVQSSVSQDNFEVFLEAIKGGDIAITAGNFSDLNLLCQEFRFLDLLVKVSEWISGHSSIDLEVRQAVKNQQERIDDLGQKFAQLRKECYEQMSSQEGLVCLLEALLKSAGVRQQGENEQLRSEIACLKREAEQIAKSNANLADALRQQGEEEKLLDGKVAREISQMDEKMREDFANFKEEVREMIRKLKKEVPALPKDPSIVKTEGEKISPLPSPASAPRSAPPASAPTPPGSPAGPRAPPAAAPRPVPAAPAPATPGKQFVPSGNSLNGIIGHLTAECGGNVHDRKVVTVTSSKPKYDIYTGKNAADLEEYNCFWSAYRGKWEDIPDDTGNNWICYDFGGRMIVLTDYAIRTGGGIYPKNWVVETSRDGKTWAEVDRRKNVKEMNKEGVTRTFAVSRREECRFIRLVNVGRNWDGDDALQISAWEVFGSLVE